jgi:hypothetical protein
VLQIIRRRRKKKEEERRRREGEEEGEGRRGRKSVTNQYKNMEVHLNIPLNPGQVRIQPPALTKSPPLQNRSNENIKTCNTIQNAPREICS